MSERLASPLAIALLVSLALHGALLAMRLQPFQSNWTPMRTLEVILAPERQPERQPPRDTRAVAQHSSTGGDTAQRSAEARTKPSSPPQAIDKTQQTVRSLERQATQLAQQADVAPRAVETRPDPAPATSFSRADLLSRGSEIARLESQVARDAESYQKRPRRKVFGVTAKGVSYARYVEDWRLKVEAIGNLNYPQEARDRQIRGSLQLLVALRSDGSVERIELMRTSGHALLDEAARRIVELGAPYAPFPEDLRRETDILEIVRTWTFSQGDRLQGEQAH